jgi:hypothetical protein
MSCHAMSFLHLTSFHPISCNINSSYPISAHLISYNTSCYVMSNHFFCSSHISSHLISPHIISSHIISPHLTTLYETGALLLMLDNSAPICVKPMFAHSREVRPSLGAQATTHQQHCGLQYPYLHFTMTKLCFDKTVPQRQRDERSESGQQPEYRTAAASNFIIIGTTNYTGDAFVRVVLLYSVLSVSLAIPSLLVDLYQQQTLG